jgi:hypothetical protein
MPPDGRHANTPSAHTRLTLGSTLVLCRFVAQQHETRKDEIPPDAAAREKLWS